MSIETPAPEQPTAESLQVDPAGTDEPLREPGKKALEAERTRAAAAEKALNDLRKEIEDSKKTAEQKANDDLIAAQKAASESATRALRYEVAAAKGLDLSLAARLAGSTKAELEADADALMALIPQPAAVARGPHIPSEGTGGEKAAGATQLGESDVKSMTPAQINKARRDGRLNRYLGIS
jgi:hypothetical protein